MKTKRGRKKIDWKAKFEEADKAWDELDAAFNKLYEENRSLKMENDANEAEIKILYKQKEENKLLRKEVLQLHRMRSFSVEDYERYQNWKEPILF